MAEHLSSAEADARLKAAKAKLAAAAKKGKASEAEIKKLTKAVNDAQAVRNLF